MFKTHLKATTQLDKEKKNMYLSVNFKSKVYAVIFSSPEPKAVHKC